MKISILTVNETRTISKESLKEAIRLKCAPCYGALSMCNALGGLKTDAWTLCHSHTLKELLDEANSIGLDLKGLQCAVEPQPIEETLYYKRAMGLITEQEFKTAFKKWQDGK